MNISPTSSRPEETALPEKKARPWWLLHADFIFFLVLFLLAVRHGHGRARLAGILLGVPALALWLVAKVNLGESFTLRAEARTLVTRGLYLRIRHPIYLFSTIVVLATALCFNNIFFYVYLVLLMALQLRRIRSEERILAEKFGDSYLRYRQSTWF